MKHRHALVASAGAIALVVAGLSWWLVRSAPERSPSAGSPAPGSVNGAATVQGATALAAAPHVALAASKPGDDPFLTPELRHKLEEMILEAGDAGDPTTLKQRLLALVGKHFPAAYAVRAAALVERYVDYRVALGQLKPPADMADPRALRAALEARQKVRQRHFSPEEYDALFAQEAQLDRFTVARIEIERNDALTPQQKQAALRDAERELGEGQRALRAEAVVHMAVAAQTAAFEARGAGEQERYAQRRAQYGEEAARQLAQLDREDRDWQGRVDQYAAAQARGANAAQLQELKQRLFNEQEQLRVEASIAARKS